MTTSPKKISYNLTLASIAAQIAQAGRDVIQVAGNYNQYIIHHKEQGNITIIIVNILLAIIFSFANYWVISQTQNTFRHIYNQFWPTIEILEPPKKESPPETKIDLAPLVSSITAIENQIKNQLSLLTAIQKDIKAVKTPLFQFQSFPPQIEPNNISRARILQLQEILVKYRYLNTKPNGVYDAKTETAIKKFQEKQGLLGEHPLLADRLFLDKPYSKVFGVQELCFFQKWMLPLLVTGIADLNTQAALHYLDYKDLIK